jgi:Tol biopolymer transport system component
MAARESKSNSSSLDCIVALDLTSLKLKLVLKLPEPANISELDLSPDGRTLAFAVIHGALREQHLARVGIDGSDYRELYTPFQTIGTPAKRVRWSKDGKAILFLKTTRPPNEVIAGKGGFQIMKIPADGGLPVPLSLEEPISSTFDLSPDGSRIAYSGRVAGVTELLVLDNMPSITKATK